METCTLLLVDDDRGVLFTLEQVLRAEGYTVTAVNDGQTARQAIASNDFDVLLTDLRVGEVDGVSLIGAAHQRDPETVGIVLTGYASMESAIQALRHGAFNYLLKPCNLDELKLTIQRGLEKRKLAGALRDRVADLEEANATIREFSNEMEDRVHAATAELDGRIQELQEARRTLEAIIDSMGDGLVVYDNTGRAVLANAYMRSLFHLKTNSLEGHSPDEIMAITGEPPLDESDTVVDPVTRQRITAAEFETMREPARSVRRILSRVADDTGAEIGVVVLYQDVTERKEVERLKDDFLSIASHELKTPLTSILGYTQLLMRRSAEDLQKSGGDQFLEVIEAQSQRMKRLVEDLLDVSRIERKALNITRSKISLAPLVESVVDRMRPSNPHHDFVVSLPDDPVEVWGESERVQQVMSNLLNNAVKYSPGGGEVGVTLSEKGGSAIFEVRDHGIGIPSQQLPNVFSRFYQVSTSVRSRQFGGMGLGLFIAKGIIDELGGTIGVHSAVGRGSTFQFTLPLAEAWQLQGGGQAAGQPREAGLAG